MHYLATATYNTDHKLQVELDKINATELALFLDHFILTVGI